MHYISSYDGVWPRRSHTNKIHRFSIIIVDMKDGLALSGGFLLEIIIGASLREVFVYGVVCSFFRQ